MGDVGLDGIGLAGSDGLEGQVDQARAGLEVAAAFHPAHAVHALGLGLGEEIDQLLEALFAHVAGLVDLGQAALGPDGPEQGVYDVGGAADLEGVAVAGGHPAGMPDDRRGGGGQLVGQFADASGRHARGVGGEVGVVGGDKGAQGVEIVDPGGGEILVIEVAGDELVDDAEIEGVVRARAHHEEGVGLGGGDGGAHVDAGDLAAGVLGVEEVVDFLDVYRLENIARLEHDVLGVLVIVEDVLAAEAEQRQGGVLDVSGAGRIVVAVVGAAQGFQEGAVHVAKRAAPVGEQDGARAVGLADAGQLAGNVSQGFVPGHLAPFALAARPGPDHGELGTFVVGDQGSAGRAPGAQRALDAGGVGVALQIYHLVAFHRGHHGAAHAAHAADAVDVFPVHCLLHIVAALRVPESFEPLTH